MPDKRNRQRNAGACDSSREGLTGSKFGMEIRTCIARSCLGFLHTKTMSAICRPNTMSDKHVYQTYCVVTSLWWGGQSSPSVTQLGFQLPEWMYVMMSMIGCNKYLFVPALAPCLGWLFGRASPEAALVSCTPKQCKTLTKTNNFCQISIKKNKTNCVVIRGTSSGRLLAVRRSIKW